MRFCRSRPLSKKFYAGGLIPNSYEKQTEIKKKKEKTWEFAVLAQHPVWFIMTQLPLFCLIGPFDRRWRHIRSANMPSNVEIKARVRDFEKLKAKAKELSHSEGR